MSEVRLIDANAIYDKVEANYRMSKGVQHKCEREFLNLLSNAPTVDVLSEQQWDLIDRHKTAEELNELADEVYYDFPLLDRETRIERERGVRMAAQYVENLAGGKMP